MLTRILAVVSIAVITSCSAKTSPSSSASGLDAAAAARGGLKIMFPAKFENSKLSLADMNKALRAAGKQEVSAMITLDLTKSAESLNKVYWDIFNSVESLKGGGTFLGVPDKGACFVGSNKDIAKNIEKLTDGWVSDQFGITAVATSNPDHLGINYHQSDDGDDVNWLNMERCK